MKLSLETSKLLKEAGFPQSKYSAYYYVDNKIKIVDIQSFKPSSGAPICFTHKFYAIPNSEEILELLPETIQIKERQTWWLTIQKCNGLYVCYYQDDGYEDKYYQENKSLPEALAAMWIYLRREKLI